MSAYRENAMDRLDPIEKKLSALDEKIDRIVTKVGRPTFNAEQAFWLALWPRVAVSIAIVSAVVWMAGYSCNHDDNMTKIAVAKLEADRPTHAGNASQDAGAK